MVDEDAFLVDKRLASVGRADDDAIARRLDLKLASRSEVEPLPQWLGHDEPAGRINGNFHATMVFNMAFHDKATEDTGSC